MRISQLVEESGRANFRVGEMVDCIELACVIFEGLYSLTTTAGYRVMCCPDGPYKDEWLFKKKPRPRTVLNLLIGRPRDEGRTLQDLIGSQFYQTSFNWDIDPNLDAMGRPRPCAPPCQENCKQIYTFELAIINRPSPYLMVGLCGGASLSEDKFRRYTEDIRLHALIIRSGSMVEATRSILLYRVRGLVMWQGSLFTTMWKRVAGEQHQYVHIDNTQPRPVLVDDWKDPFNEQDAKVMMVLYELVGQEDSKLMG